MHNHHAYPAKSLRIPGAWMQGPFRILLVEASEEDRAEALRALAACDIAQEVSLYTSGAKLVAALRDMQADEDSLFHMLPVAVILGINLPAAEGFRMLKRLKAEKSLAGAPVIALSDVLDARQVQELDPDGFLTKPLDAEKLARCLQGGLGREEEGRKV